MAPREKPPPPQLPPDQSEFVRELQERARFRRWLWEAVRRWFAAVGVVVLAATSGIEALGKLIAVIKGGPSP